MALKRLPGELVWRFMLASPFAFEDWENPTSAELNANPTNDPSGSIFNITCALNTDGTTFDLGDPDVDDSTTFCQRASQETILEFSPEITFQTEHSRTRWIDSDLNTLDNANLAQSLLRYRGVEYFAIMSIGERPEEPFAVGHRIKMARIATDWGVDEHDSGENIRMTTETLSRGDLNWNYRIAA